MNSLQTSEIRWRAVLLQILRVSLLACILFMIHRQHVIALSKERSSSLENVPLSTIKQLFPNATALGEADLRGGKLVLAEEPVIGSLIQTSPEGDRFLGFSGPTNTLIAFDPHDCIVGISILSSRDTPDHIELIQKNSRFLNALNGQTAHQAVNTQVDAVTGATLSSLAILQGIRARLGQQSGSLKFPAEYTLKEAQQIFPDAAALNRDRVAEELLLVSDADGRPLGYLLSNSPAADEVIGYQGPSLAYLGMQLDGKILGLVVKESYDNEPYVGSVRGDVWFAESLNDKTLQELADQSLYDLEIDGVSGATMTSLAVAEGLQLAAQKITNLQIQQHQHRVETSSANWRLITTSLILAAGMLIGLTSLRGVKWVRRIYQIALIGVLGFINADLLSMAMFVGWAQNGIPLQNAMGLIALSAAALIIPVFTKTNIYCDHLCPHGALQQLIPRTLKWNKRPRWLTPLLLMIRPILLAVVVLVPLANWQWNLVNLEPFDAYAWRAAGIITICLAVGGLVFSLFVPMGYCQYGCPTGAVLSYLKRNRRSHEFSRSDAVALGLLLLAICCFWA